MNIRLKPVIDPAEPVNRDRGGADPGDDRKRLAHEAARKGKDRRQDDDRDDADIEPVHRVILAASPLSRHPCRVAMTRGAPAGGIRFALCGEKSRRAGAGDSSAPSSLKCASGTVASPSIAPGLPARADCLAEGRTGTQACVKPSLAASLSLISACATGRTRPDSAISPNTTMSGGTGISVSAETSAAATARSAAGSTMRNPPAMFR